MVLEELFDSTEVSSKEVGGGRSRARGGVCG